MAALTYEQSAELMKDPVFIGRVKVSCLKYATFIFDEPVSTAGHASRLRWAQNTYTVPDSAAAVATPPVVMDGAVQNAGAAITDAALQTTVETVVNKMI